MPLYVIRDDQKSRIMSLKASGEPRWRIARMLNLPLDAVKNVIRNYGPKRDPVTRQLIPEQALDTAPILSEEELTLRRLEIQDGWTSDERADRRAAGTSIIRKLTGV